MQRGQWHWLALDFVTDTVGLILNFGNQPLVPRLQSKLVRNEFVGTCVVKKSFQKMSKHEMLPMNIVRWIPKEIFHRMSFSGT